MFEIKKQDNNGRKPLATLGNLKLACVELGIPDDKHTLRRASRAFDLYNSEKVEHVNDHTFNVKSQYTNRLPYQVWISPTGTSYCTCPDWRNYSGDLVLPDVHFHCKHAISARILLHHNGNGNGSKVVNECGTSEAKALQKKLNGDNGTGGESHPSTQLDTSNPFQECEQLDIDQIEGRSNGDLVHVLSNGEYVISYKGIMALAEQHDVTFEASRHDETHTVLALGRCENNTRISGKPINGSEMTAVELAKRNAARQLLPLVEIKALEKKAQLEAEFDWQKAKAKCLEIVPDFTFDILIHDLVKAGTLRQAHPSDYSRKEWMLIYDACKRDALRVSRLVESETETNGNDDDGGNNTPSSDDEQRACDRTRQKHGTARRVSPAVDVADPSERKAGRKAFRRKASASHRAEVPDNVDEFIAKCKEMESEVDDTTDDNSVDDPALMVEVSQMNGDGKRKLQMDKKKNILLIEPDGSETPITMRDAAFDFGSNFILRLTQGIACGGDISTVELD